MPSLSTTTTDLSSIKHVADEIALRFSPQRIILFGSHAYGSPSEDSDVDLLVIMDTTARNVDQAFEIRRAIEFPFPTDLLVRKPSEVKERIAQGDCFLQEILEKGQTLYEASDNRVG
ncbi:MAG: nucleotidyltransferase domain-containing protein [Planctomycetota bacterium]|nr:nucleotidyltransferase domain-containing protein [Planctomycetota bacterium]MDA1141399.1 nucleotidyltransferase domain-containing protein [Planctomycetota bacterium]